MIYSVSDKQREERLREIMIRRMNPDYELSEKGSDGKCMCKTCRMRFNPSLQDEKLEHHLYHFKLQESHSLHNTFYTLDECKSAINMAMETLYDSTKDTVDKIEACRAIVIAAYSRHLIMCSRIKTKPLDYDRYCAEWVACNINVFTPETRDYVSILFKVDTKNWITMCTYGDTKLEEDKLLDKYEPPVETDDFSSDDFGSDDIEAQFLASLVGAGKAE